MSPTTIANGDKTSGEAEVVLGSSPRRNSSVGPAHAAGGAGLDLLESDDPAGNPSKAPAAITYLGLLKANRPFRYFFLSYLTNHMGEWFTYLASISALERIYPPHRVKASVSVLIAVRVLPFVLLLPFGGVLADGRDKRRSMMALDLAGAAVALVFVLAVRMESALLLYAATFVQECVSALYEPSRSSIVPMLAHTDGQLVRATYLTGMAWSFMAAFGSAVGGALVSTLGIEACYCVDSATYLLSAAFITCMGGTWDVSKCDGGDSSNKAETPLQVIRGMMSAGASYVWGSFFGLLVLIKPSMEIVWGAGDILSVAFSERGPVEHEPTRLGILFASAGVGCILGPLLTDRSADLSMPSSIQRLCLLGMGMVSFGCLCMGLWSAHFFAIALFTVIRAMGSSIVWVNSALLLQRFSAPEMLGRVTSIELAVTLLANMVSALGAGTLVDRVGVTPEQLSLGLAGVGTALLSVWTVYHLQGRGAGECEAQSKESMLHTVDGAPVLDELTPLVGDPSAGV
jgi:predicted MFS family arabinose efflux permease